MRYPLLLAGSFVIVSCHGPQSPAATSRAPVIVNPIRVGDGTPCIQTSEFGNSGCVELIGRVLLADGSPAADASVGTSDPLVTDSAHVAALSGDFPTVDGSGRYRLRLTRYSPPESSSGPDTLTVLIRAAVPPAAKVTIDSQGLAVFVRARVEFRGVGQPARVYELPDLIVPQH